MKIRKARGIEENILTFPFKARFKSELLPEKSINC